MGAYPIRIQGALSVKMAANLACTVPTLQVDFEMADFHLRITSAKAKKFSNPELQVHTTGQCAEAIVLRLHSSKNLHCDEDLCCTRL